jgi:hypothetical protein
MNSLAYVFSAFINALRLLGMQITRALDGVLADLRAALVYAGLPDLAAVAIIALIPALCLIAAWRLLQGKTRLAVCAVLVAAILYILVPPLMELPH